MDGENTGRTNPFEEPGEAPELRDERSENLYTRQDAFWDPVVHIPKEGEAVKRSSRYWDHEEVLDSARMMTVPERRSWKQIRRYLGSGVVKRIVITAAVLCLVGYLLYGALFRIHHIEVVGNTTVSSEDIIRLSGLQMGQSTWNLDENAVIHRIQSNRYLRCTMVDTDLDKVTIHVKERTTASYTDSSGMRFMMDNRGYVLEESYDTSSDMSRLTRVVGMNVRRAAAGLTIILNNEKQLELYQTIMIEMKAMSGGESLAELDMSDLDSIHLETRDGFRVRMGNEEQIHQKLRAMLITRERVQRMGVGLGLIDVTNPGRPTFLPDSAVQGE